VPKRHRSVVIAVSQNRRAPAEDRGGPPRHNTAGALFKPFRSAEGIFR
jgi:hypothetical protein